MQSFKIELIRVLLPVVALGGVIALIAVGRDPGVILGSAASAAIGGYYGNATTNRKDQFPTQQAETINNETLPNQE